MKILLVGKRKFYKNKINKFKGIFLLQVFPVRDLLQYVYANIITCVYVFTKPNTLRIRMDGSISTLHRKKKSGKLTKDKHKKPRRDNNII